MFQSIVHVPVWQGAGAAHGYARGAGLLREIAELYRDVETITVDQADFSPALGNVKAAETLERLFATQQAELDKLAEPVLTLGGDCVADYISLGRALEKHGDDLAVVWVDAHPDINTPETSPSGNFHGMLLRAQMGEGEPRLTRFVRHKLKPRQLFYAGLRDADMDPEEFRIIAQEKIYRLSVDAMEHRRFDGLINAVRAKGFGHVYLHVDSDVLSLDDYPQAVVAVPGGVSTAALVSFLQAVRANFPLAGAALTEFSVEGEVTDATEMLACRLLVDGLGIA